MPVGVYIRKPRTAEHCANHAKAIRGPRPLIQGINNPVAKLTDKQVREIFRRANNGEHQGFLSEVFGVSQPTISGIKSGRHWRHLNLNKETI